MARKVACNIEAVWRIESGRIVGGVARLARADDIGDDLLRLILAACHPVPPREAQTALTLKLLGSLSTSEIAHAYVVPEATLVQRIMRAKKSLSQAAVPFSVPQGAERLTRLAAGLEVIYLILNEGYAATSGGEWTRPALCEEARRLARMFAGSLPQEPRLMAFRRCRRSGRRGCAFASIPRAGRCCSWTKIARRDRLLDRLWAGRARSGARAGSTARSLRAAGCDRCLSRLRRHAATDWRTIVTLYEKLVECVPSPVNELNRSVAIGMAYGPEAALTLIEALAAAPAMQRYGLQHAVHGDLLDRLGLAARACKAFERAGGLARQ